MKNANQWLDRKERFIGSMFEMCESAESRGYVQAALDNVAAARAAFADDRIDDTFNAVMGIGANVANLWHSREIERLLPFIKTGAKIKEAAADGGKTRLCHAPVFYRLHVADLMNRGHRITNARRLTAEKLHVSIETVKNHTSDASAIASTREMLKADPPQKVG